LKVTGDCIARAIEMCVRVHAGQTRKGSGAPYVFHPLAVAGLVADAGGDENQILAAILHDAVEDGGGEPIRAEIEERFGADVAAIVMAASDTSETPKPPWRARKEAFIARVRGESPRVKLVVAADKVHNVQAVVRDLAVHGPEVWGRFQGGHDGTVWYYRAVAEAIAAGWDHPLARELNREAARLGNGG
jgi:GTP pyrophosphokinase